MAFDLRLLEQRRTRATDLCWRLGSYLAHSYHYDTLTDAVDANKTVRWSSNAPGSDIIALISANGSEKRVSCPRLADQSISGAYQLPLGHQLSPIMVKLYRCTFPAHARPQNRLALAENMDTEPCQILYTYFKVAEGPPTEETRAEALQAIESTLEAAATRTLKATVCDEETNVPSGHSNTSPTKTKSGSLFTQSDCARGSTSSSPAPPVHPTSDAVLFPLISDSPATNPFARPTGENNVFDNSCPHDPSRLEYPFIQKLLGNGPIKTEPVLSSSPPVVRARSPSHAEQEEEEEDDAMHDSDNEEAQSVHITSPSSDLQLDMPNSQSDANSDSSDSDSSDSSEDDSNVMIKSAFAALAAVFTHMQSSSDNSMYGGMAAACAAFAATFDNRLGAPTRIARITNNSSHDDEEEEVDRDQTCSEDDESNKGSDSDQEHNSDKENEVSSSRSPTASPVPSSPENLVCSSTANSGFALVRESDTILVNSPASLEQEAESYTRQTLEKKIRKLEEQILLGVRVYGEQHTLEMYKTKCALEMQLIDHEHFIAINSLKRKAAASDESSRKRIRL